MRLLDWTKIDRMIPRGYSFVEWVEEEAKVQSIL